MLGASKEECIRWIIKMLLDAHIPRLFAIVLMAMQPIKFSSGPVFGQKGGFPDFGPISERERAVNKAHIVEVCLRSLFRNEKTYLFEMYILTHHSRACSVHTP